MEKVLEITGKSHILELRPDLELFFWGGMAIELYKPIFQKLLPGNQVTYYQIYNASEGYFATQDENNADDMLLLTQHGTFYEGIPFSEYDPKNRFPKTYSLKEVKIGIPYVLLITTNSGLRRYVLGDTISFTQLNPWKIKVIGRLQYYIDVVGECVSSEYIEKTIHHLSDFFSVDIKDYTLAPLLNKEHKKSEHCYERVIESSALLGKENEVGKKLDELLGQLNAYYYDERHTTKMLAPPKVHLIAKGSFYAWMKSQKRLGGQFKLPKLANHRKVIDPLLKFLEEQKPIPK